MFDSFNFAAISIPAILLVFITSILLLLGKDWKWLIVALSLQYVGVFLLVMLSWPLEMAVVKLVTGWMAGAVLGVGEAIVPVPWTEEDNFWVSGRWFKLFATGLVTLVIISSAPTIASWLPGIGLEIVLGSSILIGNGLLIVGLTNHPFRLTMGLLTLLAGFEILYAALQVSSLVAGLLAGVNLSLALVGAFLILVPSMETVD
jgi:hypothetical protein